MTHEVKPRFALACTVYTEYAFFRQAMKRGYTEFDRSEICFIFSLSRWTKLVNRNMILLNVSHKRSLSQNMSAVSCIPSIFMTIDVSNSSRVKKGHRVTLPSQLSGRYCMKRKRKRKRKKKKKKRKKKKKKKKKKKNKKKKRKRKRNRKRKKKPNLHFFIWSVSQNSVHSTYATILFQVGEFAKIVPRAIGLFNLSRSRPFLSWLCLACLFPLNVSW